MQKRTNKVDRNAGKKSVIHIEQKLVLSCSLIRNVILPSQHFINNV